MFIIKTILFWLIILLGIIIVLLAIFCFVPLRYIFDLRFKNSNFSLTFKFWFITFALYIGIGTPLSYKATIMYKVIVDSNKKTKKKLDEGVSMSKTSFISDKLVEKEANIGKHATKEILKRAEEYNKEILETNENISSEAKRIEDSLLSFIDSFKKFLPLEIIDAAKIITHEWMCYYENLLPQKVKMDIEFGLDDPYSVGVILAYLSPLYTAFGESMSVKPHFDESMLDGSVKIIGRPQIIFIIIPAVKVFLNKRFREIFMHK